MRIERVRVEGFGLLSNLDLAWPEEKLLVVLDGNETGKSTLCEAIVAALYGLPRSRVGAIKMKDLRRPRSGAKLAVGLDIVSDGTRWAVDRDLEDGTLRVLDRDRGVDVTREFLRSGGRDVFGDRITGLTEPLYRCTAYVAQNRLDEDQLDSTLTVELARIADSGGGEASVVRALRALADVRGRMPDASQGPTVSVDTEILRLTRRLAEKEAEAERHAAAREASAKASVLLSQLALERERREREAALAEIGVVETERRELAARLAELNAAEETRRTLEREADLLAGDAQLFTGGALAEIDRLREERAARPDALVTARAALATTRQRAEQEARAAGQRFGAVWGFTPETRARLVDLLKAVIESAAESAVAEEALEAQWEELQREGLAADLKRLDALAPEDREFLAGAEEARHGLELYGVQCDRKAADAAAAAGIAVGERRERVKRAKGLVFVGLMLLPFTLLLAFARPAAALPLVTAAGVFTFAVLSFGGVAWLRGSRHRRQDESDQRALEAEVRAAAVATRKQLSDLRLNLDRIARTGGFADALALTKAQRRARAAEEKRRTLLERRIRRDAVVERRNVLAGEIEPFREAFSSPVGLPSTEDAQRTLAILEDLEKVLRAAEAEASAREREGERLGAEESALSELERTLRDAFARAGIPRRLAIPEGLLVVEAGRRRAARWREIVEVELPARAELARAEEVAELRARLDGLEREVETRCEALGVYLLEVPVSETPETARRAAEEARDTARQAEEKRQSAERELAASVRDGAERAREAEEARAETAALLERASRFRDAIDVAREVLSSAASTTYGDFRRGLTEASRQILSSWDVPYEALEFGDDLAVAAVARGGRLSMKTEIDTALSTGAREQLHLTARLAALRYLGTGARGLPLLLDDPLVGADDARFTAVMRFLSGPVLAERPVLLVSCHGWRHERLLEHLSPDERKRIEVIRLNSSPR